MAMIVSGRYMMSERGACLLCCEIKARRIKRRTSQMLSKIFFSL